MLKTRRQFITEALEEIGIASYEFDVNPEMLQSASRKLDNLLADWNGQGLRLGMALDAFPCCDDLDTQMGIPDFANRAIVLNLALSLAPSYGKEVSSRTTLGANEAFRTVLMRCVVPIEAPQPHNMPLGAGNKPWRLDRVMLLRRRNNEEELY